MGLSEAMDKIAKEKFKITLDKPGPGNQGPVHCEKKQMKHAVNIPEDRRARAPYNFVPLNEKVVEAEEIPGKGNLTFDIYHNDKNTGYIELEITTRTPLYIRDTLTKDEMEEKTGIEKDPKKKYINSDFFSRAGKKRIPGSSLRGMVRTMVEMLCFGKFGFVDDKRLFFRAVADRSKPGSDYMDIMIDKKNNCFPRIKAGVLKRLNQSYVICPSKTLPGGHDGTQIYRINFDKTTKIVDGTTSFKVPEFEFKEVYFKPVVPQDHTHHRYDKWKKANVPYALRYAKLASISETIDVHKYPQKGLIIASGGFGKKNHLHWVINEPDNKCISVDEGVIKEYKNDSSRDERADLLEKLKVCKDGVPCFYIINDRNKVTSFGHTGMFRLSYEKTIGEHIPLELQNEAKIDIADAIFGNEKTFAGRIFFEDVLLQNPTDNDYEEVRISKTLLGPKPTTFQHYLVQTEENLNQHPRNLAHYNSLNAIRGNKLYWHRSDTWKKDNQEDFNPKIDIKMRPIKPGKIFIGNVRIENLSDVELGALLFALELPPNCCHKLGMGKPLGLGSVEIKPTLYLSERENRYKDLFAEWGGKSKSEGQDKIDNLKKTFANYILETIDSSKNGDNAISNLWDSSRMKELGTMLNFDEKPADSNTEYLKIEPRNNEFKDRRVLPLPTAVK